MRLSYVINTEVLIDVWCDHFMQTHLGNIVICKNESCESEITLTYQTNQHRLTLNVKPIFCLASEIFGGQNFKSVKGHKNHPNEKRIACFSNGCSMGVDVIHLKFTTSLFPIVDFTLLKKVSMVDSTTLSIVLLEIVLNWTWWYVPQNNPSHGLDVYQLQCSLLGYWKQFLNGDNKFRFKFGKFSLSQLGNRDGRA